MNELWLIVAFLAGAGVYRWATLPKTTETPVQTLKRAYTAITEPKQTEQPVESAPHDIEKALAELKPPNIFERREAKEAFEREQARERAKALEGIQ